MARPPVARRSRRLGSLSLLAREMTIAEAAGRQKVSEQSIGCWRADFLEAGKTALAARAFRPVCS
jgi:transposase